MAIPNEHMDFFKMRARDDLLSFCVYNDKFFEVNPHHKIIADALQRFMEGKVKKLILQTPPRSWKSRLVCESIAWAFWNVKNTDIIYTWHSVGLLESFSRSIRDRVSSSEYKSLWNHKIKSDNWAVWDWKMDNWNHLMIYWVGWGITGKWGNRLIIDDPYATRQDAESDTIRKRVEDWYDSTFLSRRHNSEAGICLIMQRWREDDLVWYILEKDNDWEIVKIPAISEEWESFWESRFPVPYLEEMKRSIGSYFFESQYQQEPFSDGTGAFNKEMIIEYSPEELSKDIDIITFIDPAISQKQEADFTAIVTVWKSRKSNFIYILEVKQLKEQPDKIIHELFETVVKWKTYWQSYRVGIEVVQYQKMLALEIQKQQRIRDIFFNLDEVNPMWEKEARILATLQPRYSSRTILHNKECANLALELLKFPNGKHDDLIDALSWAVKLLESTNISQKPKVIYSPSYAWIW